MFLVWEIIAKSHISCKWKHNTKSCTCSREINPLPSYFPDFFQGRSCSSFVWMIKSFSCSGKKQRKQTDQKPQEVKALRHLSRQCLSREAPEAAMVLSTICNTPELVAPRHSQLSLSSLGSSFPNNSKSRVCIFSLLIRGSFEVEPSNPKDFLAKQNSCTLLTWTVALHHRLSWDSATLPLGSAAFTCWGATLQGGTKSYGFHVCTAGFSLPLSVGRFTARLSAQQSAGHVSSFQQPKHSFENHLQGPMQCLAWAKNCHQS